MVKKVLVKKHSGVAEDLQQQQHVSLGLSASGGRAAELEVSVSPKHPSFSNYRTKKNLC